MHATQLHGGTSPPSTPIGLALGEHAAPTIDAAIEAVTGVAWLLEFEGEIVVATAESDAQRQARIGARIVAEIVHQRGGQVTIVTPPRSVVGSLPLLGDRSGWAEADASGRGARLDRIPVWRELTEA